MNLQRFIENDVIYNNVLYKWRLEGSSTLNRKVEIKIAALKLAIERWIDEEIENEVKRKRNLERYVENYLRPNLVFSREDMSVGKDWADKTDNIVAIYRHRPSDLEMSYAMALAAAKEIGSLREKMFSELGIPEHRLSEYPDRKTVIALSESDLHLHIRRKGQPSVYDFRITQEEINKSSLIYYADKGKIAFFKVRSDEWLKRYSLGLYVIYKKQGLGWPAPSRWRRFLNRFF